MIDLPSPHLDRIRQISAVLLPGNETVPTAGTDPDFAAHLAAAMSAITPELPALERALERLADPADFGALRTLDSKDPEAFDVLSSLCAATYYMSPAALDAIGYFHGPRRAPDREQIVNELETGILDAVMARPSMVRAVDVNQEKP